MMLVFPLPVAPMMASSDPGKHAPLTWRAAEARRISSVVAP